MCSSPSNSLPSRPSRALYRCGYIRPDFLFLLRLVPFAIGAWRFARPQSPRAHSHRTAVLDRWCGIGVIISIVALLVLIHHIFLRASSRVSVRFCFLCGDSVLDALLSSHLRLS
ncbi:hypothetical protein B0H16DRAFT_1509985 [Mycena metata]|uniref:Uncharacterized protein n=1 Tax=Mycena metata TaxID=1033252 RepID=A0AAD7JXC1_9AGAR|nr:hypothetical protein B0H16DRAFT_1509985 [Mycena metata]